MNAKLEKALVLSKILPANLEPAARRSLFLRTARYMGAAFGILVVDHAERPSEN